MTKLIILDGVFPLPKGTRISGTGSYDLNDPSNNRINAKSINVEELGISFENTMWGRRDIVSFQGIVEKCVVSNSGFTSYHTYLTIKEE